MSLDLTRQPSTAAQGSLLQLLMSQLPGVAKQEEWQLVCTVNEARMACTCH